jgi:hypothetical protein
MSFDTGQYSFLHGALQGLPIAVVTVVPKRASIVDLCRHDDQRNERKLLQAADMNARNRSQLIYCKRRVLA